MKKTRLAIALCSVAVAGATVLSAAAPASAATKTQVWQVGFSFNCDNASICENTMFGGTGGFWGWYAFYSDGTGDIAMTGCGHGSGGSGAFHENVQIDAWHIDSVTGDFVVDSSSPADAEGDTGIPAAPGHYSMTFGAGVRANIQVNLNPTA